MLHALDTHHHMIAVDVALENCKMILIHSFIERKAFGRQTNKMIISMEKRLA